MLDAMERQHSLIALVTTDHATGPGRDAAFDQWRPRSGFGDYSYRTVFPNEVVFDIGDCNDDACKKAGHLACWLDGRENVIRLVSRLTRNRIPHWHGLSGGKGHHVHVFVGQRAYRWPFHAWATGPRTLFERRIVCDPLLIDPEPQNRMVREFGAAHPATGRTKRLWQRSVTDLPDTRDEAYRMQAPSIPTEPAFIDQPPGANFYEIRDALEGNCPVSLGCLDRRDCCDECPANR